jgi:hypothetical protein
MPSCCQRNPTRKIPMQKFCEWLADTRERSSTTAWHCTSIPTFIARSSALLIPTALWDSKKKARQEYFNNARVLAADKVSELQDVLQSAFTYVRDRDYLGADQAFEGVTQQAHRAALPVIEAEAWRIRARLQFITTSADLVGISVHAGKHFPLIHRKHLQRPELEYLNRADQVLKEAKAISESDSQQEYALVLRERAEAAGRRGFFAEADAAIAQLEAMASNRPSAAIQHALDGAKGAVLRVRRELRSGCASP